MTLELTHLRKPPFNLDDEAIAWVEATFHALDEAGKVGQVFNMLSRGQEEGERETFQKFRPGGLTRYFKDDAQLERQRLQDLQAEAEVPLLISADLEGSRMSLPFGTQVPNPLALAAIDDLDVTEQVSRIMAQEARAVGLNWSFTPLLDINVATRSSIVGTRSFGNDQARIRRHALKQIEIFQQEGLAATSKHWPGEGFDARDQHLVTTINPLAMEEWEEVYGALYRETFDLGVLAVMSAHIALPSYMTAQGAEGAELYRPASISQALTTKLLREDLGFNGLIVSDASEMGGVTSFMSVTEAKIEMLRAGNDVVLFSNNPEVHFDAVLQAVRSGRIPAARFADAVSRVLGLKARLGLHKAQPAQEIPARATAQVNKMLRRAPVLEKDVAGTLPLDPEKHKRVLVIAPGIVEPLWNETRPIVFPQLLAREGFDVTLHEIGTPFDADAHDLVIYAFSEETLLTRGRIFLDWAAIGGGMRGAMQRCWHEVPTVMISFGYPHYLYDAPRVPTYINAWATMDEMQEAVVDLLLGRAEWNTDSPVDAFDGAPDARF